MKAGVKIHERGGALLHSKTALIDGVWSCVGSTNLDWRSFLDNYEVNALVLGHDFARQMAGMIARGLAASKIITLEDRGNRSILLRVQEWGAKLLQRLL